MSSQIVSRRKSRRYNRKDFAIVVFHTLILFVSVQFSQDVLLEARYNGVGMVAPQGKHLYLRVFDNGNYEFEDQVIGNTPNSFKVRKKSLSKSGLKEFSNFLNDPSVIRLPEEIPPPTEPLDHVLEIELSIHRGKEVQKLLITNFSPNPLRRRDFYPEALLELFRRIEMLRKDASFSASPMSR